MIIKTAVLTACAVLALQIGVARVQQVSGLWRAPPATCEGLPPIVLVPVPVQPPVQPKESNT